MRFSPPALTPPPPPPTNFPNELNTLFLTERPTATTSATGCRPLPRMFSEIQPCRVRYRITLAEFAALHNEQAHHVAPVDSKSSESTQAPALQGVSVMWQANTHPLHARTHESRITKNFRRTRLGARAGGGKKHRPLDCSSSSKCNRVVRLVRSRIIHKHRDINYRNDVQVIVLLQCFFVGCIVDGQNKTKTYICLLTSVEGHNHTW